MCGIFGAIGLGFNIHLIRALTIANRERGTHSLGFLSGYTIFKRAGDPMRVLADKMCHKFFKKSRNNWFMLGHTRFATRGDVCDKNAHPFRSGAYAGIHNGVITAPSDYEVDSMYLWSRLHTTGGNYQSAWESVSGSWGLAWYDGADVYLQSVNQSLCFQRDDTTNVVYFSSDPDHLIACTGKRNVTAVGHCETYRFAEDGTFRRMAPIKLNRKVISPYATCKQGNRHSKYGSKSSQSGTSYTYSFKNGKWDGPEYQSYSDWERADEYDLEKERFNPEPWWRARWDKDDLLTAEEIADENRAAWEALNAKNKEQTCIDGYPVGKKEPARIGYHV